MPGWPRFVPFNYYIFKISGGSPPGPPLISRALYALSTSCFARRIVSLQFHWITSSNLLFFYSPYKKFAHAWPRSITDWNWSVCLNFCLNVTFLYYVLRCIYTMYVTISSKSNEVVVSQSEKCAICRIPLCCRVHTSALNLRPPISLLLLGTVTYAYSRRSHHWYNR